MSKLKTVEDLREASMEEVLTVHAADLDALASMYYRAAIDAAGLLARFEAFDAKENSRAAFARVADLIESARNGEPMALDYTDAAEWTARAYVDTMRLLAGTGEADERDR